MPGCGGDARDSVKLWEASPSLGRRSESSKSSRSSPRGEPVLEFVGRVTAQSVDHGIRVEWAAH